jgi:uncharacterized protein (DUF58 family)
MTNVTELYSFVHQLELVTKRLLAGPLVGDYRTRLKGAGFEFEQLRDYQVGDDIRFIDWKSTARTQKMLVRQYSEDRNRTVMVMLDISASTIYGSSRETKYSMMVQVASVLALVALYQKDAVGLILFSDDSELFVPARASREHIMKIINHILTHTAREKKTSLAHACTRLMQHQKKGALICIVSDFLDDISEVTLAALTCKHEVIAFRCLDSLEKGFPAVGLLQVEDRETGELCELALHNPADQLDEWYRDQDVLFKKAGIDCCSLVVGSSFLTDLVCFLKRRG